MLLSGPFYTCPHENTEVWAQGTETSEESQGSSNHLKTEGSCLEPVPPGIFFHDSQNDTISCFVSVLDGGQTLGCYSCLGFADGHSELYRVPPVGSGRVLPQGTVCPPVQVLHLPLGFQTRPLLLLFMENMKTQQATEESRLVLCPSWNLATGATCCDEVAWPWVMAPGGTHA